MITKRTVYHHTRPFHFKIHHLKVLLTHFFLHFFDMLISNILSDLYNSKKVWGIREFGNSILVNSGNFHRAVRIPPPPQVIQSPDLMKVKCCSTSSSWTFSLLPYQLACHNGNLHCFFQSLGQFDAQWALLSPHTPKTICDLYHVTRPGIVVPRDHVSYLAICSLIILVIPNDRLRYDMPAIL